MLQSEKKIKLFLKNLLEALGFEADVVVKKNDGILLAEATVEEPALLIGRDGETLQAIQYLLRIMMERTEPSDGPIVVDINGYRDKRIASIRRQTASLVTLARKSGQSVEMPKLNSYERRVVHTIIADIADMESESEGWGEERRLIIRLKK